MPELVSEPPLKTWPNSPLISSTKIAKEKKIQIWYYLSWQECQVFLSLMLADRAALPRKLPPSGDSKQFTLHFTFSVPSLKGYTASVLLH